MKPKAASALLLAAVLSLGQPAVVSDDVIPPAPPRVVEKYVYASRSLAPQEMELEITAYTAHDAGMDGRGITFSGLPVDNGVLAVDPEVIPLGSVVYIPGVGYTVALDTGGAIKGRKADLYVRDTSKAIAWGRRRVKVRIIR